MASTPPPNSPTEAGLPRLLELGNDKCRACKKMAEVLVMIEEKYQDKIIIERINIRDNPGIARKYKIMIVPTQIIFDHLGKEVYRHTGYISAEKLSTILNKYVRIP